MATQKKSAPDSSDKPAAKKTRGLSFDVMPPGKVMPSATARPVITSSGPQQPDNTLTQPGSAPLMHKALVLQPTAPDGDVHQAAAELGATLDEAETAAPTAPEVPSVLGGDKPPAGRSVADLLSAKQNAVQAPEPKDEEASTPAIGLEPDQVAEPAAETPNKTSSRGLTIQPLNTEDKPSDDKTADAKPDTDVEATPESATDTSVQESAAEADQATDTDTQLADLNSKDKDAQSDEPLPPPELYGGKPVIEVHEDHPVRSAINALLLFLLILGLALLALNFLLDAGVVSLNVDLPYTDLLEP